MDRDPRRVMGRKSMLGTVLFAFGIIGVVPAAMTGSVLVIVAAVVCLAVGVGLLYQVSKALP